ncbi:MAG: RHS repeat protein [Balneolaceae bacterium]|nr:RHS repeat protein [Balneolaceae bacterium]MBO6547119.1 RHS repeat protein [Balneolaceae bacterium]MBO6647934.1 RHS repeat protein [Balneolaceae bacterium]
MNKYFFKLAFLLMLLFEFDFAFAQNQQDMMNAFPPSPEAAALGKYGEIESNLYEGKANISIPIYEYSVNGFTLPISLDYTTSAIRVDQIATNVGLGWTLNAGGVVTQTVNGLSDLFHNRTSIPDPPNTFNPVKSQNQSDYDTAEDVIAGLTDMETDLFTYNFPGGSGKFMFSNDGTEIHTIPHDALKITESSNTFEIINTDGTKFTFDVGAGTYYSDVCTGGGSGSPVNRFPFTGFSNFLSEITTTDGNVITLTYGTYTYEYDTIIDQKYHKFSGQSGCPSVASLNRICTRTNTVTEKRLTGISSTSSDIKVEFEYSGVRDDLADAGVGQPLKLDKIIILGGTTASPETLKVFDLHQSYFNSSGGASSDLNKRLKLDSVNEVGLPGWSFTYNSTTLPPRDSYAVDHWGHYNGETSNSTFIPYDANYYTSGADREPNLSYIYTGILEKVTYPTGGYTELEYETTSNKSAVRIKKLITKETSTSSSTIKEFEYVSGFAPNSPDYIDDFEIEEEVDGTSPPQVYSCNYKLMTSSPIIPFGGASNSVGHGEVIELLGTDGEYGKTRYKFTTGTNSLSDVSILNNPASEPIYSWTGGKLLEQEAMEFVSGTTFKMDQESINTYGLYHDTGSSYTYNERYPSKNETYVFDIRLTQLSKERNNGLLYKPATFQKEILRNVSAWYHPKTTKVRVYDNNGTNYMESLTEFKYDDPLHIQLTQKIETNSISSEKRVTNYEYASEQDGTGGKPNYSGMKNANMLTQLYSVMVEDDINGDDLSKSWTEWTNNAAISPGPKWRPWKSWVWKGTGSSAPTTPFTSNAILLSEVIKYNFAGRPAHVRSGGAVSSETKFYYGSYDFPLSQVGHNSKPDLYLTGIQKELNGIDGTACNSNDLCTKAFYDSKGRLIKLEDEAGNDIEFTYDSFNRLKTTINQNQETVSTINYFNNSSYSTSNPHYVETLTHYDPNNSSNVTKSINYFDGLGRGIQSQTIGDGRAIITGVAYNDRGQPSANTRPIDITDPSGYKTNLFSGFDANTGEALDSPSAVEAYYDTYVSANDANYAYSHTQHEPSPSAKALKSTLPGFDNKYGSGNEIEVRYDLNTATTDTFQIDGKVWDAKKLLKTINEDPEGNESITYSDAWGRTIVSGVNMNPLSDDRLIQSSDDLITRYSYDELGNLVKVIDPRGFSTVYKYNKLGQLEEKKLPDQDYSNLYCYDDKGRLRFHAAPAQAFYYTTSLIRNYTYTKYDDLDRPIEVGERTGLISYTTECDNERNDVDFPESSVSGHTPFINYSYDGDNKLTGANNYEGKLTRVEYKDFNSSSKGYTWYSYNNQGLVAWVVQELPGLGSGQRKRVDYTYDELGRLTKLSYQASVELERFYLWYNYDGLGRLESIESNSVNNKGTAQMEAQFTYEASGQVKRLRFGDAVEDVDYTYTIQGWLDKINNNNVYYYTTDKFGMDLDYNLNGTIEVQKWVHSSLSPLDYVQYEYLYDRAGQLTDADYTNSNGSAADDNNGGYDVVYGYDKNGNITTLTRKGKGSGSTYPYYSLSSIVIDNNSNRLESYRLGSGPVPTTLYNVQYDASGNTTANRFSNAEYDWRNLPTLVEKGSSDVEYAYDAEGMRVKKELVGGETIYYVRGAGGQTIAAYDGSGDLLFLNILAGSNILGQVVR